MGPPRVGEVLLTLYFIVVACFSLVAGNSLLPGRKEGEKVLGSVSCLQWGHLSHCKG